jgi:hypothetical protein
MAAATPPYTGVGDAGTVTLPNSLLIGTGFARSLVISVIRLPLSLPLTLPGRHQESTTQFGYAFCQLVQFGFNADQQVGGNDYRETVIANTL